MGRDDPSSTSPENEDQEAARREHWRESFVVVSIVSRGLHSSLAATVAGISTTAFRLRPRTGVQVSTGSILHEDHKAVR